MMLTFFFLFWIAFSVVAGLIFAFLGHGLSPCAAWGALLFGSLGAAAVTLQLKRECLCVSFQKKKISFWEWSAILIFIIVSLRAFLWLVYRDGDLIKVLSPNNLGDLSLHITFIRYLATVTSWWPPSPILIHEPLRYPLGMDFFNSLLLLAGVPLEQGLVWVGLLGALLAGITLWWWGRGIALAAFLFNGGLAGLLIFKGIDPDTHVAWKNIFLSMFITQRGFLFALPAGLLLLTAWKKFLILEKQALPFWVQVFLLAVIPLFNVHTFLFLAVVMLGIMILISRVRRDFLILLLCSWPWSLLAMWMVSGGRGTNSIIAWHVGWMQENNEGWFWVWNFGLSLPLAMLLILKVRKNPERAFIWPAAALFLSCCVIRFAPWPWDNMKLMIWAWLTIAPFLWSEWIVFRPLWFQPIIVFFLFASGFVTLFVGLDARHGYEIARQSELAHAAALISEFSSDEVIATAPEYNHPVLLLGHPVVAGYEGHLWSHGLCYEERLKLLRSILQGDSCWEEKARTFGVSSIYWSEIEQRSFPNSQLPFAKKQVLPIIYRIKQ